MSDQARAAAVLFATDPDRIAAFYSAALGLAEANRDHDHILLESPAFQLVVHRIPWDNAAASASSASPGSAPPARRADAAFKPVFFVPSLASLRAAAATHGGVMEPADKEWSFNGVKVCDAIDPEGNVVQFREIGSR